MTTRNWSIRSKIIVLLLIPLLALVVLWGFATTLTVPPAISVLRFRTTTLNVSQPAEVLVTQLQRERRMSLVYLGGRADELPALDEQRTSTDEAIAAFRRRAESEAAQQAAGRQGRQRLTQMLEALDGLNHGRSLIDGRDVDRTGALDIYNRLVDTAFQIYTPSSDTSDKELSRDYRTVTALERGRELLAREDALISGAIVGGRLAEGETVQVVQLIGLQRFVYANAVADLGSSARADYRRITAGRSFAALTNLENRILTKARDGAAVPVDAGQWRRAFEEVVDSLRDFEVARGEAVHDRAQPVAVAILIRLAVVGVLGLIAVAAAVFFSLRMGRSLVGRLGGLRRQALELADERLPSIVRRLRAGEEIDVSAETTQLKYGTDEIGQVARAFTAVQRTAVRSAIDEANLRRGLNEVFLNIARRSQTLVHRQLTLLDKMERGADEPEELAALFQIDHLATRMRRHAEDLVVLAGAAPGRGWRHPVPVVDIVRGAISEVEDYARVVLLPMQEVALIGPVVGDVIHLLAELIENATTFSPPDTKVRVNGQAVPNGYVLEIEDRGLGMSPEAVDEANGRLAVPPDLDPANSARLGLFVVAKLASRHDVRVRLRHSPYGGITAVVLIPGAAVAPLPEVSTPERLVPERSASERLVPERSASERSRPGTGRTAPVLAAVPDVPADAQAQAGDPAPRPAGPLAVVGGLDEAAPAETAQRGGQAERAGTEPVVLADRRLRTVRRSAADSDTGRQGTGPRQQHLAGAGPARPAVSQEPGQEPPLSEDGLPRRIRQASLAPQLRDAPRSAPVTPESRQPRTPEQIRSRMSALQFGTRRGRMDGAKAAGLTPIGGAVPDVEQRVDLAREPDANRDDSAARGTDTCRGAEVGGNAAPADGVEAARDANVDSDATVTLSAPPPRRTDPEEDA